jgi:hypothetical protein
MPITKKNEGRLTSAVKNNLAIRLPIKNGIENPISSASLNPSPSFPERVRITESRKKDILWQMHPMA